MIERYMLPEMGHIWSLENKFDVWKEIEILACEAQAELGQCGITAEEAAWIRAHADFTVPEIAPTGQFLAQSVQPLHLSATMRYCNSFLQTPAGHLFSLTCASYSSLK